MNEDDLNKMKQDLLGLRVRSIFGLQKMKQFFGEPVLLGFEKMQDFNDYAESIIYDLEPPDALTGSLVWQFILTTYHSMRLVRYQSRVVQSQIIQQLRATGSRPQDKEEEAAFAARAKIKEMAGFDYLISQLTKRASTLLQQISFAKLAWDDERRRHIDALERHIDEEEKRLILRKQQEQQQSIIDNAMKAQKEREKWLEGERQKQRNPKAQNEQRPESADAKEPRND